MTEENKEPSTPSESQAIPENLSNQILYKFGLVKTPVQAAFVNVLLFIAVAFLPLVVLSMINGTESDSQIVMPLHTDWITLTRYLVVVPVLLLSQIMIKSGGVKVVQHFRNYIDHKETDRFINMAIGIGRKRNSLIVNLIALILAIIFSIVGAEFVLSIDKTSWQSHVIANGMQLTNAGYWNLFVSQPLFKFVMVSWFFDYCFWAYFLWKASKFSLRVVATHPDNVGGLSFIRVAQSKHCVEAFALSCSLCSMIAQSVYYMNIPIKSFYNLGGVYLVLILSLFSLPLLVFSPLLYKLKLDGVHTYGALCTELCNNFANKWVSLKREEKGTILDSADPSALCDMNGSYEAIKSMKPSLISRQFITVFAVATCLPAIPLVTLVMPLKDILIKILQALT